MARNYQFISESSNSQKLRIFLFGIVFLITVFGFVFALYTIVQKSGNPYSIYSLSKISLSIENDIKNVSPVGLFYLSFIGGLFFIPIPIEIFFFTGLVKGNPVFLSALLTIAGMLPTYTLDYYLGLKFSRFIMTFVSKKRVYGIRRWVSRYGSYTIFFANLIPSPSPVLSFGLGITRYNFTRLTFLLVLGAVCKYALIILFFRFFIQP